MHHLACGILFPKLGIEPMPPTLEVHSLNQRIAREVLKCLVIHSFQRHQLSWNCVNVIQNAVATKISKIRDLPEGICGLVRNGCMVCIKQTQFYAQHPEGET